MPIIWIKCLTSFSGYQTFKLVWILSDFLFDEIVDYTSLEGGKGRWGDYKISLKHKTRSKRSARVFYDESFLTYVCLKKLLVLF